MQRSPIKYEEVESSIEIIILMSDEKRRTFRVSLLRTKGITTISDALTKFSRQSHTSAPEKQDAIAACFSFYFHSLNTELSTPWIHDAVSHGFFEVFGNFSPSYMTANEMTIKNIKDLLGNFLPSQLVYMSVVSAVVEAMNRDASSLAKQVLVMGRFQQEWMQFCSIALERFIWKQIFEIQWDKTAQTDAVHCSVVSPSNIMPKIDNSYRMHKCSKSDSNRSFSRCAKCKSVIYCSKECQVYSWNHGHKGRCKFLCEVPDSGSYCKMNHNAVELILGR